MPRHSPYALTYFSLHGLHKYCARHTGYELDFMLPRILSYYSSAQGPEGPHASFTIQHVKEQALRRLRCGRLCNCPGARSPPGPLYKQPPRNCISSLKQNKKIVVELQGFEPWTPALQRQCSSQLSYSPLLDVYYRLMSQCN